jgi:hypothetical protein
VRAVYALAILALLYPALTDWAFGHITVAGTAAAIVLLARHAPRHSHPIITFLVGAGIATWITGHRTKTTA